MAKRKLRVCAVSYLNTAPLVWGMLHGEQRHCFDLLFEVPSVCADLVASGDADIGIIPTFELHRQQLATVPGVGIACRGAVRSILLVSKVRASDIQTLAADCSSRTSVALAQVLMKHRFRTAVEVISHSPDLESMLQKADAALIIGDPALRVDPENQSYHVYDLGAEWRAMTGLPMVFAVWAGRAGCIDSAVEQAFQDSCRYGLEHIEDIVKTEAPRRGVPEDLARRYLTSHIVFELGPKEYEGMSEFLRLSSESTMA